VEVPGSFSSGSRSGSKVINAFGIETCCLNKKIKIIRFNFFAELRSKIKKELGSKRYDYVIHSAAVSDFAPRSKFKGKFDSKKSISLSLRPLPKIYKDIRRISPKTKLVMFKLENRVSDNNLIQTAKLTQRAADAEFIVANRLNPYRAFIIDREGNAIFKIKSKRELINKLLKVIQ